ncbi:hypothetical protein KW805_01975 [Candidatus Pacearchaeota archaeon]|nr:hypothetical protein [Candidatus Pacearchaeota archaeon]
MGKTFIGLAALLGTIVGAGFLGIPYVVMQSGFLIGVAHLVLIACIIGLTTLYMGEVMLRTKEKHHLVGYAERYLGKKGKMLMLVSLLFGLYSALLAYLVAEGQSLSQLLFNTSSYSFASSVVFWAFLSLLTYEGMKALKKGEAIGLILMFVLIISLSVFFSNKINIDNITYLNTHNFLAPFGVIVFSFLGFSSLASVEEIIGNDKRLLKRIIILAYILSLVMYIIFAFLVIGFKGQNTPQLATLALGKPFILLGVITMFNSYLALSIALTQTFHLDLKKKKTASWIYSIIIPIIALSVLEMIHAASFVDIIGLGGVLSGSIGAILIILMVKNAKKEGNRKPEYSIPYSDLVTWILIVLFAFAGIAEIIKIV